MIQLSRPHTLIINLLTIMELFIPKIISKMNNRVYLGVDNGSTGTIGIIEPDGNCQILAVPTIMQQDYTKAKQNITRLNYDLFYAILDTYPFSFIGMERPMVNPKFRWPATKSALRIWEAQLIAIEHLKIPYIIIDSKVWQKEFFPNGFEPGHTKELSNQVGRRLFPKVINPFSDYDGLLLANYVQLKGY